MTARPDVSVVIPTRDRWDLLSRQALRAALAQQGVELEVVVVDDGSSVEVSRRLDSLTEPRLRVIRHERSQGVAAARNTGIKEARGAWIAFLDDDDSWSPCKIRHQLDTAHAAQADFVYAGVVAIDERGSVLYSCPLPRAGDLGRLLLASCVIPAGPSNVLARAELVRSLGGFDTRLSYLADWELWIRLAWAGLAAACDEVLVAYREHSASMSVFAPSAAFAELALLERKHEALHRQHGVEVDRVSFSHYLAWCHLRRRSHSRAAQIYLRSSFENRRPGDLLHAARFAAAGLVRHRGSRAPAQAAAVERPSWLDLYT